MIIAVVWLALCFVASSIASGKGRSGAGFFFASLVLSPVVGIIAALVARPSIAAVERQQVESGALKKCPFCAEIVKAEAEVCRYCGRDLPDLETAARTSEHARFETWLGAQSPPVVNPSPSQRAEYRTAYDYKRKHGEL